MTESTLPAAITTKRRRLPKFDSWTLSVLLVALLAALPILVVFSFVFAPTAEIWAHLSETVLKDYIINSAILMVGVGIGVLMLGLPAAWLTSMCEFPGERLFRWMLLLPMAMPAYIIAYTYTGLLDFAGPVQTMIREMFGVSYGDYWFPEIRSLGGAICMLSLVLYPYVYLLTRAAFLEQSVCVLEVSRTLSCSPLSSFGKVALPLARPAIITGLSLALMETLADYGTVQYFGISTFTTGIFRTWFGLGDSAAAAQLSALLMGFVFLLVILERWSRKRARFHHTSSKYSSLTRYKLTGWKRWAATIACLIPVTLGFIIPVLQLGWWSLFAAEEGISPRFLTLTWHSLVLAAGGAIIAVLLALLLGYGKRLRPYPAILGGVRVASMGYAVPGTVIAVGIMMPFAWLDTTIDNWMRNTFDISTGLLLSGTVVALLFAYTVRFLAVSLQAVEAGLGKIKPTMDDAGRLLGLSPMGVLRQIHYPLMKGTVLTALLLVFVDVLKELPATLILRPFNFNTLAVRAYEMASDERLADAALPALMIVVVGILPVILLSRAISTSRAGS